MKIIPEMIQIVAQSLKDIGKRLLETKLRFNNKET